MKVSVKQLSKITGFSPATISNALNRKKGVSAETSEKILRAAREHGYALEEKNFTKRIRVVTYRDSGEIFSDTPFFLELLEGVENESHALGYETAVVNLYQRHEDYQKRMEELLADAGSGILLIGTELTEESARPFAHSLAPLVLLDAYFKNLPFDAVLMDNDEGVESAVHILAARGHTEIGYLRGSVRISNFERRALAFYNAMVQHGLQIHNEFIVDAGVSIQTANDAVSQAIKAGHKMPTAFFADNDMIALGAMQAFQAAGWKIPDDISIVGFDDITFAKLFSPGLATVRVFKKELGAIAVQKLLGKMKRPSAIPTRTIAKTELIVRDSIGEPSKRRLKS